MSRRRICVARPPRSKRASTGSTHSHTLSFSGFLPGTASLSGVTNGSVTEAVAYGSALTVLPIGHEGRVAWSARASNNWKAEPLTASLSSNATSAQTATLNPFGPFRLNDHGDIVLGDNRRVIEKQPEQPRKLKPHRYHQPRGHVRQGPYRC